MAVARGESAAVIYDDDLTVAALTSGEDNSAVGCGYDGRAPRCRYVLPCVEFIGKPAEWVGTTAEAVCQISCDRPDVRRHIALTKASFVNLQIMFKLRGLRFNLCNTIHRPGGAARPVRVRLLLRLMLFFMSHSAHLCEAARLVFNCLDPLVQLIELLLLPLILHAQALVLALYAKMHGLLRQSVKTVERGAEKYGCN